MLLHSTVLSCSDRTALFIICIYLFFRIVSYNYMCLSCSVDSSSLCANKETYSYNM